MPVHTCGVTNNARSLDDWISRTREGVSMKRVAVFLSFSLCAAIAGFFTMKVTFTEVAGFAVFYAYSMLGVPLLMAIALGCLLTLRSRWIVLRLDWRRSAGTVLVVFPVATWFVLLPLLSPAISEAAATVAMTTVISTVLALEYRRWTEYFSFPLWIGMVVGCVGVSELLEHSSLWPPMRPPGPLGLGAVLWLMVWAGCCGAWLAKDKVDPEGFVAH